MPVSEHVAADVASGRIRAVLVTSGSVARQVQAQLAPLLGETVVAAIGPRTAFDARAAGLTVHVIAESRSSGSLVAGLAEYVISNGDDHSSDGPRDDNGGHSAELGVSS